MLPFLPHNPDTHDINFKYGYVDRGSPDKWPNWRRCSPNPSGGTKVMPNQWKRWYHTLQKVVQPRNKWFADSSKPHPLRHIECRHFGAHDASEDYLSSEACYGKVSKQKSSTQSSCVPKLFAGCVRGITSLVLSSSICLCYKFNFSCEHFILHSVMLM